MKSTINEHDFVKLIQDNERIIYKICSFYASDNFPLADLYQDVIYNLWKGFPKFRKDSSYGTWIYRIALNTCISGIRKEKKQIKTNYPIENISEWFIEPESLDEEIREMYRMINQLKTLEKMILLLYLEEKSYQEIADITGLTLSNVATKLKRTKEKLKQMSNQKEM